jgi:hypothetical protein
MNFASVIHHVADQSGRGILGMNCLRSLERWGRGFDPNRGMGVPVCSVFLLGSGLATGWLLVQGVIPNVLD